MPRLCPRCKSSVTDEAICPACGFLLPVTGGRREGRARGGVQPVKWQQTAWGKILIGLVLSAGLFYGLLQLINAIVAATAGEQVRTDWVNSLTGLLVMQGLQAVSLLVGGMMAGAGQRRGTLYGSIVGVYNAFLFLLIYVAILKNELPLAGLIGLPLLQIVFGSLGGFLGYAIWKPIATVAARPDASAGEPLLATSRKRRLSFLAGPVSWFRVCAGSALAVAGTLSATNVLFMLERTTNGLDTTLRQTWLLTWEISVLSLLAGGVVAGSNSNNGIKQGLVMGTITSVVLVLLLLYQGERTTTTAHTLGFALCGIQPTLLFQKIVLTILMVVPLGMVGGWFGSQLLPPLLVPRGRRPLLPTLE